MKRILPCFLALMLLISGNRKAIAEGTNPVSPNSNNISALLIAYDIGSGSFKDCGEDNRVYFDIKDYTTEKLYFGFDWRQYTASGGNAPRLKNLYYRIRRPNGTVALTALWNPANKGIGWGDVGVIANYTAAFNGPNIGSTSNGYSPLVFSPTSNGSYWIEFFRSDDDGVSMITSGTTGSNGNRAIAPLFDLTVANSTSFQIYNGRVHSDKWAFLACEPGTFRNNENSSAAPKFYAYTGDSVTVKIDIQSGFRPIAFDIAVNNYGVAPITAVNPFNISRKSRNSASSPSLLNGYHVFLNVPDVAIYPPGSIPGIPQFASTPITGCGPYKVRFITTDAGDVKILLNLNGIPGYQPNTTDRMLEAFGVSAGLNDVPWDGKDGLGNLVAPGTSFKITATVMKGRFNIPFYDAEINAGGMIVDIISPYFGRPDRVYWDDAALVNVGNSCSNENHDQNNVTGWGIDNSIIGTAVMPTRAWNANGNPSNIIPAPEIDGSETDDRQCNDFGNVRTLNTWGWGVTVNSSELEVSFGCNTTVAINDENSTWINVPVSGDVKTNDFDPQGDIQTFGSFLNQSNGSPVSSGAVVSGVDVNGSPVSNAGTLVFSNGNYTFTPATGFTGYVSVPYNTCDNGLPSVCDTAVLTITVTSLPSSGNNSLIANNDENISYGDPVTGNVTSNDHDPEFDPFSVTGVTGSSPGTSFTVSGINVNGTANPNAGTLVIGANGSYTFTPTPGFIGHIDVPYTITDSHGATATAVLHIDVLYVDDKDVNNPPFAGDDFSYTQQDIPVTGSYVYNDSDPDGNPLSFNGTEIVTSGPHTAIGSPVATVMGGTIQFYLDGTYLYNPPSGYTGPDRVIYTICDIAILNPHPLCASATVHILIAPKSIVSGNVFDDANGLEDALVNGTGTNAGGLNAVLVNSSGNVVSVVAVNADGTYTFPGVVPGTYSAIITTSAATIGNPAPAPSVHTGWVNTGEGTMVEGDGNVNGQTNTFTVAFNDISNVNFGLDQIPTADNINGSSQVNPGGTVQVTVPTLTGSDPEDGTYTGVSLTNTIIIQSLPSNGTLYYNGTPVSAGQVINNYDPGLLTVDPYDGAITVTFTYSVVDAATVPSPVATVNIPFSTVSVSGTVYNDLNGLTDNLINGIPFNAGGLYAVLINTATNNIAAVQAVGSNGTYNFNSVNGGQYYVLITNVHHNVGNGACTASVTSNWVYIAEGSAPNGDGDPNGQTNMITVSTSNVTDVNFGIEQLPTAYTITAPGQNNPEGTANVTVPSNLFLGTDPDGGSITGLTITGFPSNVTTITIDGITYNSSNFPSTGVFVPTDLNGEPTVIITVDPFDGFIIVDIPYIVYDNANLNSNTGHAIISFTTTLPVSLLDFTASKQGGSVVALNWSTSQEINTSHFELERSANGGAYNMIHMEQAAGNSSTERRYAHFDKNAPNGTIAYRLKIVDNDGHYTYSPIRVVQIDANGAPIVYPNPAKNGFTISFSGSWQQKFVTAELFDAIGKRILVTEWKQCPASAYINTMSLQSGSYMLKLTDKAHFSTTMIIQIIK